MPPVLAPARALLVYTLRMEPAAPAPVSPTLPTVVASAPAVRAPAAAPRTGYLLVVALTLFLALALRVVALRERGIVYYDEAMYLLEGRFFAGALRSIPDAFRLSGLPRGGSADDPAVAEIRARISERTASGVHLVYPKPTHSFLVGCFLLLCGDTEWAGHLESVLFSMLAIILVLILAHAIAGGPAALLAAFLLAIAPLDILLARSSFAEADSAFFLLAAVALLRHAVGGGTRPLCTLFAAGLATGLCYTCNHRNVIAPLSLWLLYAAAPRAPGDALAGRRLRGLLWLCLGMLLPLVGWEALLRVSFEVAAIPPWHRARTYFARLWAYLGGEGGHFAGAGSFASLPEQLWGFVGAPTLGLAALGLAALARRGRFDGLLLAVPLLAACAFYQSRTQQQLVRYLDVWLPFLAIAAGVGGAALGAALAETLRAQAVRLVPGVRDGCLAACVPLSTMWAAVLLGTAFSVGHLPELAADRSGYPEVFAWLREMRAQGEGEEYLCDEEATAWYYDPPAWTWCHRLPATRARLEQVCRGRVRWLVLAPTMMGFYPEPAYLRGLIGEMQVAAPPLVVPFPPGALPHFSAEYNMFALHTRASSRAVERHLKTWGDKILVYDLRAFFAQAGARPGK
ncbi:MAG: glycosyltransferase family 39 protein [Planctomycetes bacterium]|nr:glycosyltransferase family 39 protein [Planctomycetota bacterium]